MTKNLIRNTLASVTVIACGFTNVYGQETEKVESYESFSLKDLLNVKIVSASKKEEYLFESPLSASVVTKEDIAKAGCTSIMEAFRLVPGMIVREESNGNYDIHMRGLDNVPPYSAFDITTNTTMLVMIDNRVVYNYLKGGTFWETLPVDLNDVERIEIIRGPAAALYGPNAMSGVVHIITRHPEKDGLYAIAKAQQGSNHTFINNASLGYQFNKKWNVVASANYQRRERSQTSYYEMYRDTMLHNPDTLFDVAAVPLVNFSDRYPNPGLAMEKYAANIFLNHSPAEKINYTLAAGAEHSTAQKVFSENFATPLSTTTSNSRYADLKSTIHDFSSQFSYNSGTQNICLGTANKYDFRSFDANMDYTWKIKNLSVKPGLSYRTTTYDDTKYSDLINKSGILNAKGQIITQSASLRLEHKLLHNKLRLIAGFRTDKFNHPDTTYLSYQFGATYNISRKHIFRVDYSMAPRSPFIYDTYVDKIYKQFPTGPNHYYKLKFDNNKDLKLLTSHMFEIGYRGKLASKLEIDVELFANHVKNYSSFLFDRPRMEYSGTDTTLVMPIAIQNLPLKLEQYGATISLNYNSRKLEIKPFITLQQTHLRNYSIYANTAETSPSANNKFDPALYNSNSGIGQKIKSKSTPSAFGGATINYSLGSKVNINLMAYYFSSHYYYHLSEIWLKDGTGIDHIPAKLILNAKVSYKAAKGLSIFSSAKNILDDKSREFFHTDDIPFMLLGGISYEF